ncbi:MAG: hypothetical protein ACYSWW_08560 [Planctomycetota bacterium]
MIKKRQESMFTATATKLSASLTSSVSGGFFYDDGTVPDRSAWLLGRWWRLS